MSKAKSFQAVDLETAADGGLQPCIGCDAPSPPGVTEGDSQWLRRIDDWHRAGQFDSLWEQVFARRILARISGITVDDVEVQTYISAGTDTYKVDFFIPKARLVLEVDGYAKGGTPPTVTDNEKRNRRDAALQTQELQVLHFTNSQVQHEPNICQRQVTAALSARVATPVQAIASAVNVEELTESSRKPLLISLAVGGFVIAVLIFVLTQMGAGSTDNPVPANPPTIPVNPVPGVTTYANCDEARADGVTPLLSGTEIYAANSKLDGDKDGKACEGGSSTAPLNPDFEVKTYANCEEARADGVTPLLKGTEIYAANSKLDGDKDGKACE
jgi:very-short-patch-repair endonuclease